MILMGRKNKRNSSYMRNNVSESKRTIEYVTSSAFAAILGQESIMKMIHLMEQKAHEGDMRALSFCLERVAPHEKPKTYARVKFQKKLETQEDIDKAMSAVVLNAMGMGDDPLSLEEAETLTTLLIRKKETMDECLHGEIVEMQKKIGMIP